MLCTAVYRKAFCPNESQQYSHREHHATGCDSMEQRTVCRRQLVKSSSQNMVTSPVSQYFVDRIVM